jgi:hypothetical protein
MSNAEDELDAELWGAFRAEPEDATERNTRRRIALSNFMQQSDGSVRIPLGYAVEGVHERVKIRRFDQHDFDSRVWYDSETGNQRKVPKTYQYSVRRHIYSPEEVAKRMFPELIGVSSQPFVTDGRVYVKTWSAGFFASLVKERSDVISGVTVVDNQTCTIPSTQCK